MSCAIDDDDDEEEEEEEDDGDDDGGALEAACTLKFVIHSKLVERAKNKIAFGDRHERHLPMNFLCRVVTERLPVSPRAVINVRGAR